MTANSANTSTTVFRLSPLIRITLLSLYVALTVPLPFLAQATAAPTPPSLLWVGIAIGFVGLYAVLTERVIVNDQEIQVTYPVWVPRFFRKGWTLPWSEVKELKPRSTGQGGLVYCMFWRKLGEFLCLAQNCCVVLGQMQLTTRARLILMFCRYAKK